MLQEETERKCIKHQTISGAKRSGTYPNRRKSLRKLNL